MTLRGSEQSLLHNLILPIREDKPRPVRAVLNIILATAAASGALVLSAILLTATLERNFERINIAKAQDPEARERKINAPLDWTDRQAARTAPPSGDVIIRPEPSFVERNFKHLTRETGPAFSTAREISREAVLRALARSRRENFAIASDLKFYRTLSGHIVLACPGATPPGALSGTADPSCFMIETGPFDAAIATPPGIL